MQRNILSFVSRVGCFLRKYCTLIAFTGTIAAAQSDIHSRSLFSAANSSTHSRDMASDEYSAAFVTCPDISTANEIARGIVQQKLAACVNVIPGISSVYEWQGSIEESSEILLMIKTRTSRIPDVVTFVNKNHPFEVPEVISMKIDQGSAGYLQWIAAIVPRNGASDTDS